MLHSNSTKLICLLFLKSLFIFFCFSFISIFSGCKNFLDGEDLLSDLENAILYQNSKEFSVVVEAESSYGNIKDPGTKKVRVGDSIELSFNTNTSEYLFLGWECVQTNDEKDAISTVEFKDILSPVTTAKIKSESEVTIRPKCVQRPYVKNFSPAFDQTGIGVAKNTSIIIELAHNIDFPQDENGDNINILSNIIVDCDGPVTSKFSPSISDNVITLVSKELIDLESGTKEVNVKIPGSFYYTTKNVTGDDVKVYLSSEYDGNTEYYVTKQYLINSTTSEQTEIYFSLDSEFGKLDYVGQKTLNIGEKFTVSFTKNNGFNFNKWSITAPGYTEEELLSALCIEFSDNSENEKYSISGKVTSSIKGIRIGPQCNAIPTLSFYPPIDNAGFPQDTNIIITFSLPVNKSDFINSDGTLASCFSISCDQHNLLKGEYEYFGKPYFDTSDSIPTGTILTIPTLPGKELLEVNDPSKKIVSLSLNLSGKKNAEGVLFTTATDAINATVSYSYLINSSSDNEGPGISVKMYSDNDSQNKWYRELTDSLQTKGEWQESDYHKNHVSKVYVCVQGYDKDSGLKCLRIHETRLKNTDTTDTIPEEFTNDYGFNENGSTDFIPVYDEKGMQACDEFGNPLYEYNLIYNFKSKEDGLIQLDFCLVDKAGNESRKVKYEVIKDTIFAIKGTFDSRPKNDNDAKLPVLRNGIYTDDWYFRRFTITEDTFWGNYKSDRVVTIELDDECSPPIKILEQNNVTESIIMNKLKSVIPYRNAEINYHLYIYCSTEDGLSDLTEIVYPSWISISNIYEKEQFGKMQYFIDNIDFSPSTSGSLNLRMYYTYQKDENSEPGELKYLSNSTNPIKPFQIPDKCFTDSEAGIYKFYLQKNLAYLKLGSGNYICGSLGKPYSLYYKMENPDTGPNSIEYPDFEVIEKEYILNESIVRVKTQMEYTKKNDITYELYLTGGKYKGNFYSKQTEFNIESGGVWTVQIAARDANGRLLGFSTKNEELKLNEQDNRPPSINVGSNTNESYRTTNDLLILGKVWDKNEKDVEVYTINEFDYYFVPQSRGKDLPLEELSNYRKYSLKLQKPDQNPIYIPYNGLEDGYYFLYTYIKDSSGNYSVQNQTYAFKYYIINYQPELTVKSDKIEISAIAYSDSIKPSNYTNSNGLSYYPIAGDYINIQYLDTKEDKWKERSITVDDKTKYVEKMPTTITEGKYKISLSTSDIADAYSMDKYLRIYVKMATDEESNGLQSIYLKPLYVLPAYVKGDVTCKNKSWIDTANGKQIFCDSPSFCHTMYCAKKLTNSPSTDEEVKNFALEWETRGVETGIVSNDSMYSYTNDNLKEIPSGSYYTTICHFADGTVLMTAPVERQ